MDITELLNTVAHDADYDRDDAIAALEDGEYIATLGASQEVVEEAHDLLKRGEVYLVVADEDAENVLYDGSNSQAALFGGWHRVYKTRLEAKQVARILSSDHFWGDDGDLTAGEVGITYRVEVLS